jgi:hypothetical protein
MSRAFSLAGFEVTLSGRFWVTPEAKGRRVKCVRLLNSKMICTIAVSPTVRVIRTRCPRRLKTGLSAETDVRVR